MLVILSDLHFVDGTAGDHNLSWKAYRKAFGTAGIDLRYPGKKGGPLSSKNVGEPSLTEETVTWLEVHNIKEIQVVFLGDIFDIARSMKWFRKVNNEEVRPWGTTSEQSARAPEVVEKSLDIMELLTNPSPSREGNRPLDKGKPSREKVWQVCEFFRDLKRLLSPYVTVKYTYVPGNHDRFMYIDSTARKMAADALALDQDPTQPFDHLYSDKEYRVVAFHGHETDLMNFGRDIDKSGAFEPEAWGKPSIGEAITIDVAVRIVYELEKCIKPLDKALWDKLETRVENMDNIRPVSALFTYLKELERHEIKYHRILDEVVKKLFDDFAADSFAFVRMWSNIIGTRHLKRLPWYFRFALTVIFAIGYRRRPLLHNLLDRIDKFAEGGFEGMVMESALGGEKTPQQRIDDVCDGAFFKRFVLPLIAGMPGDDVSYVVWGHTHHPEVLPVWRRSPKMMLLNTGTFRPRVLACGVSKDATYITQETLSFSVFYKKNEIRGRVDPVAETINGTGDVARTETEQPDDGMRYEHWHGVAWRSED